jgi:uncharacterized protein YbjT (DUF2867 family)
MIGQVRTPRQQLVTVFGGSGFLGRFVVWALARRGYRIRVATRRPHLAQNMQTFGAVGQVCAVQANLRYPESVRHALEKADHVVNLVGILQESGRQTFDSLLAEGPRLIAELAAPDATIVHISAIGADPDSASHYGRAKAAGEAALLRVRPDAIVMRPSVLFGPGDGFFERFATLARMLPVLPLAGAETRFQPVAASDVGEAVARAIDGTVPRGRIYEFGGPEIRTLREIVEYVLTVTERRRFILPLPWPVARAQGSVLGFLDRMTFGLMPGAFVVTRDQISLLEHDNVVSEAAIRDERTLQGLGITPTGYDAVVPSYLVRFRKRGQFDLRRNAIPSTKPDLLAPDSTGPGSGFHPERAPGPASGQRGSRT